MKTLIHTNENKEATYYLTRSDADGNAVEKLCWRHEEYPGDKLYLLDGTTHGPEHDVTDAEAEKLAVAIRGGNLTDPDAVVESPVPEPTPPEDDTTVTKKKTTKK